MMVATVGIPAMRENNYFSSGATTEWLMERDSFTSPIFSPILSRRERKSTSKSGINTIRTSFNLEVGRGQGQALFRLPG